MALLWCDGFDHYGGDADKMADGAWAEVDSDSVSEFTLDASIKRTGSYSLRRGPDSSPHIARRVLGGAKTTVGVGFAVYYTDLPNQNGYATLVDFRDNGNRPNVSIVCESTGDVGIYRGDCENGTRIAVTTSPPIVASAFQHVEVQATVSATVGAVEVRVNGVTVLSVSNVNTIASAAELYDFGTNGEADFSQIGFLGRSVRLRSANLYELYYDDIYAYDTLGPYNNTWQGDRRVFTIYPDGDTAQADWTPTAGPGYDTINAPLSDATYIEAGIPGSPDTLRSDFDLQPLPEETGLVSGIVLVNRVKKNEAGVADVQAGIILDGFEADGVAHPVNPIYTYHQDVFQFAPNTGSAFTPDDINALQIKINRVT
jgi:hypothetical protein